MKTCVTDLTERQKNILSYMLETHGLGSYNNFVAELAMMAERIGAKKPEKLDDLRENHAYPGQPY